MEKKERGITLIALVLTIIVMLILVAVSINVAVNGGLFKKAGEAVKKTEISKLMEDWMVERWGNHTSEADEDLNGRLSEYFGNKYPQFEDDFIISNGKVLYIGLDEEISQFVEEQGGVKAVWIQDGDTIRQLSGDTTTHYTIGQDVSYTPTPNSEVVEITAAESGYGSVENNDKQRVTPEPQENELTWKILGVDLTNTNNLLITTGAPTTQTFCLYGAQAYNNGPNIMNRVCEELYSFKEGENIKYKARSMTIEDVNNCLGFNPTRGIYYTGSGKSLTCNKFLDTDNVKTLEDLATKNRPMITYNGEEISIWSRIALANASTPYTFKTPDDADYNHIITEEENKGALQTGSDEILRGYPLDAISYNVQTGNKLSDAYEGGNEKTITDEQKNLIFGSSANIVYWLASRGVVPNPYDGCAFFGPGRVANGSAVSFHGFFGSYVDYINAPFGVRPVVSIPVSEIQLANQN